jgi:hypothetical protein
MIVELDSLHLRKDQLIQRLNNLYAKREEVLNELDKVNKELKAIVLLNEVYGEKK